MAKTIKYFKIQLLCDTNETFKKCVVEYGVEDDSISVPAPFKVTHKRLEISTNSVDTRDVIIARAITNVKKKEGI